MSDMTLSSHAAIGARTAAEEARRREERLAWKLAAPAIILTVLLILLPTAAVIFWSLTNFELGYDGFEFIGLENYAELFNDRTFLISLKNTAIYTAIVAPASVFLGLGVALISKAKFAANPSSARFTSCRWLRSSSPWPPSGNICCIRRWAPLTPCWA